jgi:iron donor protein CyaY
MRRARRRHSERSGAAFFLRPVCGRRVAESMNLSSMYDSSSALVALDKSLVYAQTMLEKDFQRKADTAFEDLKRRLLTLGDEHGFDVEGESGKLEVIFEEPEEAKFVVSPNTPVREIWISALSTSFKLGWSDSKNVFILEKTGESLLDVMSRVVSQQLGTPVKL